MLPVAGETLIWLSGGGAIVSISCWISFQSEVLSWTVYSAAYAPRLARPVRCPSQRLGRRRLASCRYETRISYPYRSQSDGPERCATRGRRSSRAGGLDQTATPGPRARAPHGGQGITREAHAHPAFTGDELTEFGQRNGFCTDNIEFTAERRRFRLRKRRWKNPLLRGVLHGLRRAARRAVLVPLLARRIHLYKRALFNIARVLKALASSG